MIEDDFKLEAYDFELPDNLIAQNPLKDRDFSKLLILDKNTGDIDHAHFFDIIKYINPGDLLIFNNTKVIPARIKGKRSTGGNIEFLLLKKISTINPNIANNFLNQKEKSADTFNYIEEWESLIKPSSRIKINIAIVISSDFLIIPKARLEDSWRVEIHSKKPIMESLLEYGEIPLPQYIKRDSLIKASNDFGYQTDKEKIEANDVDSIRYQTVYAKHLGSSAAPTAGLHFTDTLLKALSNKNISYKMITLHVGIGTFMPVRTNDIRDHKIHTETCFIPHDLINEIAETKARGNKVIAVGTTSLRAVESFFYKNCYDQNNCSDLSIDASQNVSLSYFYDQSGYLFDTNLFVYPGFKFLAIDSLITNFHFPKSSLLMLVSAFSNRKYILNAYHTAITNGYRFFSYGDAMFIHSSL